MIDNSSTLPVAADAPGHVSPITALADIPEEEIWLQKQKSARTRRAYRLDVQHFMRMLAITTPAELRQADHKAVIAWERYMRETFPGVYEKYCDEVPGLIPLATPRRSAPPAACSGRACSRTSGSRCSAHGRGRRSPRCRPR